MGGGKWRNGHVTGSVLNLDRKEAEPPTSDYPKRSSGFLAFSVFSLSLRRKIRYPIRVYVRFTRGEEEKPRKDEKPARRFDLRFDLD